MKRILNNAISFFVVAIVLLLLIPLPPFALDMMIIFNLSISLVILLITMNIRNPLEFAIFPSLLLVTTLIRLGLNISSTRSILTKNGDAGKVIHAFGSFVLPGECCCRFHYLPDYCTGSVYRYHQGSRACVGGGGQVYPGCDARKADGYRCRLKFRTDYGRAG